MSASSTDSSGATSTSSSVPALTTTFTPAASCFIDLYQIPYTFSDKTVCVNSGTAINCNYYHLGRTTSESACFPSGFSTGIDAYYSPGICPSGYTEACSTVTGDQTLATCCPSSYVCQSKSDYPFFSTNICTTKMGVAEKFVYTTSVAGKGAETSTLTKVEGFNAYGLRISYASSDFASASATSSTTGTTAGTTATTTSTTSTPTNTGSSDSSSGLSTGATAGIAVGVSLGALAVIGVLAFLFLRRRRKARAAQVPGGGGGEDMDASGPQFAGNSAPHYAAVPTESPGPYQMDTKPASYSPSPITPTPPPHIQQYAEVSGENYMVAELPAEHMTR